MTAAATDEVITSHSPQDPGQKVATVPVTRPERVAQAAERARAAQRDWWRAGAAARSAALAHLGRLLAERVDEGVDLVVREVGKPVGEARAELTRAINLTAYYAQQALAPVGDVFSPSSAGRLWSERRPHGVAGLVTPWNFPVAIPLWKAAPALAVGNAVLLKPSPFSVGVAQWLAELAAEALPPDLFQVVAGGAETGAAVVQAANVVSFTGSAAVGREVVAQAAARGVPVQAEMGGQNAAIVLPDADPDTTPAMVTGAATGYAGQKCTATRRIIVVGTEKRLAEMRDAFAAAMSTVAVGDPREATVTAGPVISQAARDRVVRAADEVRGVGGRVLNGGRAMSRAGWFVEPTLAEGVPADHWLVKEELFGPFAVLIPARDVAEAVRIAESVRFGLVTSVHGRDVGALLQVVDGVGTGMVKVNAPTTGVDFYAPFGGERDSSYGPREQGLSALEFYTSARTVTFAPHP